MREMIMPHVFNRFYEKATGWLYDYDPGTLPARRNGSAALTSRRGGTKTCAYPLHRMKDMIYDQPRLAAIASVCSLAVKRAASVLGVRGPCGTDVARCPWTALGRRRDVSGNRMLAALLGVCESGELGRGQ
jgi:hypothetical protein